MQKDEIKQTENYKIFIESIFNRDVRKTQSLESSMVKYGFLSSKAIQVKAIGRGLYSVVDGHHRLFVAKKIGIPVKYIVETQDITMHELEATTRAWNMNDFITSYTRGGNEDYSKVEDFSKKTGVTMCAALSILAGEVATNGNQNKKAKAGVYKAKSSGWFPDTMADLISISKDTGFKQASNRNFLGALSKVVLAKCCDIEILKSKIKTHSYLLSQQATVDGYLELIDIIYNRQSRKKIPVKHLSNEAAKKRDAIKSSNGK